MGSDSSTRALLAGHPLTMLCVDQKIPGGLGACELIAKSRGTDLVFWQGDALKAPVMGCDLLYIDDTHTYEHLKAELEKFHPEAVKWIIVHDMDEEGVRRAVDEFVKANEWRQAEYLEDINPMVVLETRVRKVHINVFGGFNAVS